MPIPPGCPTVCGVAMCVAGLEPVTWNKKRHCYRDLDASNPGFIHMISQIHKQWFNMV